MSNSEKKKRRFIFLSKEFYDDYPHSEYPEIEQKGSRPYIQVYVQIDGVQFALPLRSHIKHSYVIWTDKENGCGVDLSKAVVITEARYIDKNNTPQLRQNEYNALKGKDHVIKMRLEKYIRDYKAAKSDLTDINNERMCKYSTLQYFEQYISGIGEK